MTKALVFLVAIAIVLGIIAFFAVFSPGTYLTQGNQPSATGTLSFNSLVNPTGTPSGTATSTSNLSPAPNGTFVSSYGAPYIETWQSGQNMFSVAGAAFDGSRVAIALNVQIGGAGGCVPIDLRLVTDESGDVTAPTEGRFTFPDTHSCTATPGAAYTNQTFTFSVAPNTPAPFLFTTGGASNQFFELATTTSGGIQIQLPATSG